MPYIIEKTFNSKIFTKVGNPIITDDGIASGFSGSNYLTTSNIQLSNNAVFEFRILSTINTSYSYLFSSNNTTTYYDGLKLYREASTLKLVIATSNSTNITETIFTGLQINRYYDIKIIINNTNIKVLIDGVLTKEINLSSNIYWTNATNTQFIIGTRRTSSGGVETIGVWQGSIDLKQFKIYVDGKVVLNGTTSKEVYVLPSIQELKDYYSNTLIIQYNGKPKAKATIEMLVDLIYDNVILNQIQDAFDWKTAVGKQLDIIGKWVGVSRSYNFNPLLGTKLSYPQYERVIPTDITDAQQHGYSNYETFADDDGGQLTYKDLQSVGNALNDDAYRIVIGLKIIYNNINHIAGEIDNAIWDYFNHEVYTTWQNHTIVYNFPNTNYYQSLMQICKIMGVLPAPTGTNILLRGIE